MSELEAVSDTELLAAAIRAAQAKYRNLSLAQIQEVFRAHGKGQPVNRADLLNLIQSE